MNSVPITIGDSTIEFVDVAEHVGIVRSVDGNLPHILNRISAHRKALHAVLPAGLARAHRGNPIAALRVEKLYGVPVLLSGTASLVLKKSEVSILTQHYKNTLQNLLKLHDRTPDSVVYFLAGSLPAVAMLHLKQLSLFSMITRLSQNILNKIGRYILTVANDRSRSWFLTVRDICQMYQLPHPLSQLDSPLSKEAAKQLFRFKVTDFWQTKLRNEADALPSLDYFKPQFMSLSRPHPIFQSCGNNSYEICKSIPQARMVSGRYRTDKLARHFNAGSDGNCSLCSEKVPGSIDHILIKCVTLSEVRLHLLEKLENDNVSDIAKHLILSLMNSDNPRDTVQFLLDCSTISDVIFATQSFGVSVLEELFRFTRLWCFAIHKKKLKLQGRWIKV